LARENIIRKTETRGFTLIEVLVSLAILAVLATTVLAARNRFLVIASDNYARLAAVEEASRLLDETLMASDPTTLEKSGGSDEPVSLKWSRDATPYESEDAGGLYMVEITVRYGKGKDKNVRIALVTGTPKKERKAAE